MRTLLKSLIFDGDCIRVGTLFETGLNSRLYGTRRVSEIILPAPMIGIVPYTLLVVVAACA